MGTLRPVFDTTVLNHDERARLDALAPDRTVGVLAAQEYLDGRIAKLNLTIALPAILLLAGAILFAIVVWAMK